MLPEHFKEALDIVVYKLNLNNIPFVVIGSTNLALQGMAVLPRDIDISVNVNNLERIEQLFSKSVIRPKESLHSTTGQPAWHVLVEFQGVQLEFVGEQEKGTYLKHFINSKYLLVHVDTTDIPCLTLHAEIEAYEATNRTEKAKLIKTFMQQKRIK